MPATGWGVTFSDGSFFPFKSGDIKRDKEDAKGFADRHVKEGAIARPLGGAGAYDAPDLAVFEDLVEYNYFGCG